jgi:tagatose 6-phosphate kinase
VAITPCLQRTLVLSRLTLDAVNRARRVILSPGGKSVNAARALCALGGRCQILGFCGAETGRQLRGLLDRSELAAELVSMERPTRTCTTLIDDAAGTVTELVEEAPSPTTAEWQAFEIRLQALLPHFALAIAAGALPPGVTQESYIHLAQLAAENRTALLLDASGAALLPALSYAPLLVKLNHLELAATTNAPMGTKGELIEAARRLVRGGANWVLITHGSEAAFLVSDTAAWQFHPPRVRKLNPVGSGDAATGGIAFALLQGRSMLEAVRLGIACGSANATTLTAGEITSALTERLAHDVRLQRYDN